MAYLDSHTIDEITKHRSVYVALQHDGSYEDQEVNIVAVNFTWDGAARLAALSALEEWDIYSTYDPHQRWFLEEVRLGYHVSDVQEPEWNDYYDYGPSRLCRVEEWLSGVGKQRVTHFDINCEFKEHIADKRLSCKQVKQQLDEWRSALRRGDFPHDVRAMFCARKATWGRRDDRESWVKYYGSKAPYPRKTIQAYPAMPEAQQLDIHHEGDILFHPSG